MLRMLWWSPGHWGKWLWRFREIVIWAEWYERRTGGSGPVRCAQDDNSKAVAWAGETVGVGRRPIVSELRYTRHYESLVPEMGSLDFFELSYAFETNFSDS